MSLGFISDTFMEWEGRMALNPQWGRMIPTQDITNKDKLTEHNIYSIFEYQDFIECFITLAKYVIGVYDFIKEHDCFLNLHDAEWDEISLFNEVTQEQQDNDAEPHKRKERCLDQYIY